MKTASLVLAAAAALTSTAHAHAGHGLPEATSGIVHYLVTPEHGPLSLLLLVGMLLVGRALIRLSRRG